MGTKVYNAGGSSTTITSVSNESTLVDSLGRMKVSDAVTLFDSRFPFNEQSAFWDSKLIGTATSVHEDNTASVNLSVSNPADNAIHQTREYVHYQSGKAQVIKMTYIPDPNTTDVSVVIRSKATGTVVDTVITQENWNVDTFNGIGQSGIALDPTKVQCAYIEFIPDVVSFGFVMGRSVKLVHTETYTNSSSGPYLSNPSLPLRYEVVEEGGIVYQRIGYFDGEDGLFLQLSFTGAAGTLKARGAEVSSEGGYKEEPGIVFAPSSGATVISLDPGATTYIAARHIPLFYGRKNLVKFFPLSYGVTSGDELLYCRIVYNPTIVGGTWNQYVENVYESGMEVNTTITSFSGGLTINSEHIPASGVGVNVVPSGMVTDIVSKLPFGLGIDNDDPIPLLLEITNLGATSTDVTYTLKWKEIQT